MIFSNSPVKNSLAHSFRGKLFHILHKPVPTRRVDRYANYFLTAIILINCAAVALETVPSIIHGHEVAFFWLEAISTAVFVMEYILRLWVCVEQARFARPLSGRLRYAIQPLPLLDLIVTLNFFDSHDGPARIELNYISDLEIIRHGKSPY
jgi:voltage-gated potassium channel